VPAKLTQRNKKYKAGFYFENKLKKAGYDLVIGIDEAGRGPLAGPVVAAAVVLRYSSFENRIDDSKKLSSLQRESAFQEIIDKSVFGIGVVNEKVIDSLNILNATRIAMEQAVLELVARLGQGAKKQSIHLLVDGDVKLKTKFPFTSIIKGDARSKSIASASILAKVTRDKMMDLYDKIYPQYGFKQHKGYPTKAHRIALKKFGPTIIHRNSFCLV
jgi:ribonuclease HII